MRSSLPRASAAAALPRREPRAPTAPSRLAARAARPKGRPSVPKAAQRVCASAEGGAREPARKKHAAPEAPESVAHHVEGLASTAEADGCIRLVYDSEWTRPVIHVACGAAEDDLHVPMKVLTPHDDVVDASEVEDPAVFPKFAVIPRANADFCLSGDAVDAWDNPGRRPYARYHIDGPGTYVLSNGVITRIEEDAAAA